MSINEEPINGITIEFEAEEQITRLSVDSETDVVLWHFLHHLAEICKFAMDGLDFHPEGSHEKVSREIALNIMLGILKVADERTREFVQTTMQGPPQ